MEFYLWEGLILASLVPKLSRAPPLSEDETGKVSKLRGPLCFVVVE